MLLSMVVWLSACSISIPETEPADSSDLRPAAEAADNKALPSVNEGETDASRLELDALQVISPANLGGLTQLASLEPYFPPHTALSPDGRVAAWGGPRGVKLFERDSGKEIMTIPAELPECQFGAERYMALSADGSFIALVTRSALQVWQAGGGLLYEAPYSRRFSTDPGTCGVDMPRLALSPDGRLLAVSGMAYTRDALTRFFRVIDIIDNQIVYEWDGTRSGLHGSLDAAPGLGFSRDGRVLQTFDTLRFVLSSGAPGSAFRFWSTEDWEEIDPEGGDLAESYTSGELLFALHTDDGLEVRVKTSSALAVSLPAAPCSRLYPCQVRFSPDGSKAVLLTSQAGAQPYRGALLADRLTLADFRRAELFEGPPGLFRDLEGVQISDDGQLLLAQADAGGGIPGGAWWTGAEGFDGLLATPDGQVYFTPQVYYLPGETITDAAQPCPYCAVCRLDLPLAALDCRAGFTSGEGDWLILERSPTVLAVHDLDGRTLGTLQLPDGMAQSLPEDFPSDSDGHSLVVRMRGFSASYQTAFYCLEQDQRAAGCTMLDLDSGRLTKLPDGFSLLRFSPDVHQAVFFDQDAYQVVLVDLESGRLSGRSAFQARAYPAPACFYEDGTMLAYLIQELKDRSAFWLELVEVEAERSLGRVPLKDAELVDPVALSADPGERLWALGERDGRVLLLDFESGALLAEWQAHTDGLIGLQFTGGGHLLASMGPDGLMRLWGVPR